MSVCTCPFAHHAGLLSLTLLELSGNLLSSVPTHLPPSIQQLYLSNNSLSQLSGDSFSGLPGLKYLRLSRCGLQSRGLRPQVFNLSSLVELDLSYNKLAAVPTVPTSLQYLYLEANEIKGEVLKFSSHLNTILMRYVTDLLPERPSVGEPDLTLRGMTECGKCES